MDAAPGFVGAPCIAGLEFEGTPHRALADARNIARLMPLMYRGG